MIHIATVHWKKATWIDIQMKYFELNIKEPYRVYAFLNDIDASYDDQFYYTSHEDIASHAIKLNLLADVIVSGAADDDLLMFVDGDAFPIQDVSAYARPKLESYPLLAVQRFENNGDLQPHPCFCITTVGFWKRVKGDWKKGDMWTNTYGKRVTDVGGNLLHILEELNEPWYPMRRSNVRDLHDLWFGIYDGIAYHHGAGFRGPTSRIDSKRLDKSASASARLIKRMGRFTKRRPDWAKALLSASKGSKYRAEEAALLNKRKAQDAEVLARLKADPSFYEAFLEPDRDGADPLASYSQVSTAPS